MAKKTTTRPNLVIIPPVQKVALKSTMMREINKNIKTGRKVLILDVNDDCDYSHISKKTPIKSVKKLLLTNKTKKSKK